MKQKLLLRKKIGMLLAILIFSVASAQAVTITYSLTTHVDGRTITGTANVSPGASLEDNMPQDLWRGYTTYTYYSDAAKTQKITTAPAEDAPVYVDYVFDPPFLMSNENKTVWNYIRNYVDGGSTQRFLYYNTRDGRVYQQKGTSVTSYKKIQWAFYGDSYDFNIKLNDPSIENPWLVWGGSNDRLQLGTKPGLGWQLYANAATSNTRSGGTVAFGRPDNKDLIYMPDLGIALKTQSIDTNRHKFDNRNQLVSIHSGSSSQATDEREELWLYAFFASPISSVPATGDIWHVTYKIQKADGTWYDNIVIQKNSNESSQNYNLVPTWPVPGFTEREGYTYDYFYQDADFTENEKWPDGTAMPNDRNTVLYIREVELIETPWQTLVLPFGIDDLAEYFGGEGAVSVDEYYKVDGQLSGSIFKCHLYFKSAYKIKAGYPYLFKANHVKQSTLDAMYATTGNATLVPVTWQDENKAPGIDVSMIGVLNVAGEEIDGDGLHFYFASKKDDSDVYRYGFVINSTSVTIPQNRCYFYVTDTRTGSVSPLTLSFDDSGLTGIGNEVTISVPLKSRIYNINGQLMNAGSTSELPKGIYIVNGKKFIVK